MRAGFVALVLFGLTSSGCYKYVELDPATLAPGQEIRVTMTREETMRQADVLGSLEERVQGTVAPQSTEEGLALTFRSPLSTAAGPQFRSFTTIPFQEITLVEGRAFSWGRTAVAVGVGAVVAGGVLALTTGGGEGERGEGGDPDNSLRFPILQVRW
jgi:hypothetical protein